MTWTFANIVVIDPRVPMLDGHKKMIEKVNFLFYGFLNDSVSLGDAYLGQDEHYSLTKSHNFSLPSTLDNI